MNTAQANLIRADGAITREDHDEFLNKRELATRLKMTVRTVENWQRRGVLPYFKIGKVVLFHWPDVVQHFKGNFRVCRRTIFH